ncbi:MAG: sigma-54 dependent transcriptional regulator [Candidatus Sumerlaeota bacterium]|nr:sigma-54 dependent transcriptional regulator [Candidatus Sumerlaeota bacterium]
MTAPRLLLIEDDPAFAEAFRRNLRAKGFEVEVASAGERALERMAEIYFDLVITDIRLPGLSGLEILERVKSGKAGIDPQLPVVVVTSVDSVGSAVEAMKLGAADYITKESDVSEIILRLGRALEQSRLVNENRLLRDQLARNTEFAEIIGQSLAIAHIKSELTELAGSSVSVLLVGETGVGKELVARAIHRIGPNAQGPFIEVNCAALPDENFFQSEVFGHEKGAFTGAIQRKKGRFELAEGGTLFLDEIGDLPLESQAKLLRSIETMRFMRLGGTVEITANCRLVFATNRDLAADVRDGHFREDLYYRVNVYPILVPPLRERHEDVAPLMRYFLDSFADKYSRRRPQVSEEALAVLQAYHWPGNIRELRNIAERLIIRAREAVITPAHIQACGIGVGSTPRASVITIPEEGLDLEEVEKNLVVEALEKCGWNQKRAAQMLSISADRMNARVKKFNLSHPSWRVNR